MFKKLLASIFLLLFVINISAFGQLKIGYMNTQEVLSQVPERSDIEQKLNSFVQEKRQELQQQTAAFQDSVAEYQQNQSAMSDAEAAQAEERLSQMEASMNQFRQSIQQQVQQRRAELLEPLYNKMNASIEVIAEQRNLDFVINEATSRGENVLYYKASQQMDITEEVLQQMNETSAQN